MRKPFVLPGMTPVFATVVCLNIGILGVLGSLSSGNVFAEARDPGLSPFHLSQLQRIPLEGNEPLDVTEPEPVGQAMLTMPTEHPTKHPEAPVQPVQAKHDPTPPKHPLVVAKDSPITVEENAPEKISPEKPVSLNTTPAAQTATDTPQSPDQTDGFHPAVNTQSSPAATSPAANSTASPGGPLPHPLSQFLQKVGIGKPVILQPLGAIAVFPVYQGGGKKAFEDLPVVLADEFARFLENKATGTRVFNPLYTVEEFKVRGLGGVYDKVIHYYIRARRPEPKALQYLVKQLTADGRPVERVVFVESDFDMNHIADPSSITDRVKGWTTDALPKVGRYHVKSRVQVFDVTQPDVPMVWSYSWNYPVKASEFPTLTSSVFSTPDATRVLSRSSRWISREILPLVPHRVYANELPLNNQQADDAATQKDVKAQVVR